MKGEKMSNTINTAYNAQVLVGQNGTDTTSTSVVAKQSENGTNPASSNIPQDTLTISDEAKSLASASKNNTAAGKMSGSSSGNDTEDLITKLKEKIAQLEKEIAKEKNSSKGGQNNQTIKIKEALLTSYQAQLAALLAQASQS